MKVVDYILLHLPFFLNEKQLAFKCATQKLKVWLGGRGSGKTNIEADTINDNMAEMPGSKGFLYGIDLTQLKTKEIPEIFSVWKRMGMSEYSTSNPMGDYVIGTHPPKGWKIENKYEQWTNVISFPDGCTVELISQKMRSQRGGSYDWGVVVEASLLNGKDFWANIYPMVRGNLRKYKSNNYLSWCIFSNMPWATYSHWVPELEQLSIDEPDKNFFIESTIYDNIKVFGKEYIKNTKKTILSQNPLVWKVEYMNERNAKLDNAFYHAFKDEKHLYYDNVDGTDPFYKPLKPLVVSLDFNKVFNSAVVGQHYDNIDTTQNEFYSYADGLYTDIAYLINDYYKNIHINKEIELLGDQDGNDRKDQNGLSFFDNVANILREQGWVVRIKKHRLERNPTHLVKHFQINETLTNEKNKTKLLINADKCPYLVLSIKNAQRNVKTNKKDKSSEQKLKGEDRRLATDLSDCWDYKIMPILNKDFTSSKGFDISFF